MQFHPIEATPLVANVNTHPDLEIVLGDTAGNVVCVSSEGDVLWDISAAGGVYQSPTATMLGNEMHIALMSVHSGKNYLYLITGGGKVVSGYPILLSSATTIVSPVVMVDLHPIAPTLSAEYYADPHLPAALRNSPGHAPAPAPSPNMRATPLINSKPIHMVVASYDGHVAVVDTSLQCAQQLDIGEHIYSTPLFADTTASGKLSLLLGTLAGNLYSFSTSIPAHAMNSWASFPKPGGSVSHGVTGVSFPLHEKLLHRYTDMKGGTTIKITFDIWDRRSQNPSAQYHIQLTKGTNKENPLYKTSYSSPGRYTIKLPVNPPDLVLLYITLTTEHGEVFEDSMYLEISTRFYVWLKYFILVPVAAFVVPLLLSRKQKVV